MIPGFFKDISHYVQLGGVVMWPLILLTFILWYALGHRFATLRRGNRRSVPVLIERYRKGYDREPSGIVDTAVFEGLKLKKRTAELDRRELDDLFFSTTADIGRFSVLVRSIVAVAPLLGLLGTVSGMIEMFNSLGDSGLYSQSGGIAAGISKALFTTQLGLAVAVPGLIIGRILDKRARNLSRELDEIKGILCSS